VRVPNAALQPRPVGATFFFVLKAYHCIDSCAPQKRLRGIEVLRQVRAAARLERRQKPSVPRTGGALGRSRPEIAPLLI